MLAHVGRTGFSEVLQLVWIAIGFRNAGRGLQQLPCVG